jgi:hypothetical protein
MLQATIPDQLLSFRFVKVLLALLVPPAYCLRWKRFVHHLGTSRFQLLQSFQEREVRVYSNRREPDLSHRCFLGIRLQYHHLVLRHYLSLLQQCPVQVEPVQVLYPPPPQQAIPLIPRVLLALQVVLELAHQPRPHSLPVEEVEVAEEYLRLLMGLYPDRVLALSPP